MFTTLKKLNYLLDRRSRRQFCILFVLLVLQAFLDGVGIGLIAPYIAAIGDVDLVFNNQWFLKINKYVGIQSKDEVIIYLSIVLFISLFITYVQSRLIFSKRAEQGRRLFSLYLNSPYAYHLDHNTAELDRNIRFEIGNIFSYVQNILRLLSNILLAVSILFVLIFTDWKIVLMGGLGICAISTVFHVVFGKYSVSLGKKVQSSQLHIGQALQEGFGAIKEVKLLGVEHFFPNRYFKYMMENARANWNQSTLSSSPRFFFEILAIGALASIIIIFQSRGANLQSILPIIALYCMALIRLLPAVASIANDFQSINFLAPSVNVVHDTIRDLTLLISSHKPNLGYRNDQMSTLKKIKIEHLSFKYPGAKSNNIDDISLIVPSGKSIAFAGSSGAGKTTLANLILGLLKPTQGSILFNELDIHQYQVQWRNLVGYVPQFIYLTDASIKENIALGFEGKDIDESRIWEVLKSVYLDGFVKTLPNGLNTLIGEDGVRLSGGQRQRLGIARALYHSPEILIFDEATSSLDNETEKEVTEAIESLSKSTTLIIIAHRLSTIKKCDCIYLMKDGKIIASGTFEELLLSSEEFQAMSEIGKY
jgi:ABC-type multidrug transport system fused ATPase/permease subunit